MRRGPLLTPTGQGALAFAVACLVLAAVVAGVLAFGTPADFAP